MWASAVVAAGWVWSLRLWVLPVSLTVRSRVTRPLALDLAQD